MKFFRSYNLLCVIAITASIIGLFAVKYRMQILSSQLSGIESQIKQRKEAIHILKAEFAYLSKPQAIKALTERYLDLKPIDSNQIIVLK